MRHPLLVPELQRYLGNPNRDQIAAHFGGVSQAFGETFPDARFLFLCFTNRCGSTYLAELLMSTGVFKRIAETLNASEVLRFCAQHNFGSFQKYFEWVFRRDSKNGRYGVKVAPEQIALLIDAGILDVIGQRSDFVFIHRTDTLGQAISRVISEQNERWAWDTPSAVPDSQLEYSTARIAEQIEYISSQNQSLEQFFGLNGISPIKVEYERLVEDPQGEMDRIARRLGIPSLTIDSGRLRLRRQANETNQSWRARFLASDAASLRENAVSDAPAAVSGGWSGISGEPTADVIAHVQNVGDVRGDIASWTGFPGSGLWLEGFSLCMTEGLSTDEVFYSGTCGAENALPWSTAGAFCGTRSRSLPLRGVCIELSESARARFNCAYVATFVDGSKVGPVPAGQMCHATTMAPIEAFRVMITTAST